MSRDWMILSTVEEYVVPLLYETEEERDKRFSEMRPHPDQTLQKFHRTVGGWALEDSVSKTVYDRDLGILREALREAVGIIESLADQQAMPDDFYVEPLAYFKAQANSKTREEA